MPNGGVFDPSRPYEDAERTFYFNKSRGNFNSDMQIQRLITNAQTQIRNFTLKPSPDVTSQNYNLKYFEKSIEMLQNELDSLNAKDQKDGNVENQTINASDKAILDFQRQWRVVQNTQAESSFYTTSMDNAMMAVKDSKTTMNEYESQYWNTFMDQLKNVRSGILKNEDARNIDHIINTVEKANQDKIKGLEYQLQKKKESGFEWHGIGGLWNYVWSGDNKPGLTKFIDDTLNLNNDQNVKDQNAANGNDSILGGFSMMSIALIGGGVLLLVVLLKNKS